jgi:hypothetical protein
MYEKLINFKNRLEKLTINLEFVVNYPWVYLDKINGIKVNEKFEAEHGFCIGFAPIKLNGEFKFTNIKEIFKIIRKYTKK